MRNEGTASVEQEFLRYIHDPQHWNRYPYVLNNPLSYIDQYGRQELEAIAKQALQKGVQRLAKYKGAAGKGVVPTIVDSVLEFIFGPKLFFDAGGLNTTEAAFAKEVMHFEGRSFTGTGKAQPGIDGALLDEGSLSPNPQPVSLQENSTGGEFRIMTDAGRHEASAQKAGLKGVALYVKATDPNVTAASVVNFIKQGGNSGFIGLVNRGVIKSATIFTQDGVVRVENGKVLSCNDKGECQ
jgi:hypothetical protein